MIEFGGDLNASDWLALAAILVAALFVIYVRWAWSKTFN